MGVLVRIVVLVLCFYAPLATAESPTSTTSGPPEWPSDRPVETSLGTTPRSPEPESTVASTTTTTVRITTPRGPIDRCAPEFKPYSRCMTYCECVYGPNGREWRCVNASCEVPSCVDSVLWECCPECPNGPNCRIDGQVVPFGQSIFYPDGQMCFCFKRDQGSTPEVQCLYQPTTATTEPPQETTIMDTTTTPTQPPGCTYIPKPNNGPCHQCDCVTVSGVWQWQCIPLECRVPPCADGVRPPGQCCYQCPNGPNCQVDGIIIPQGDIRITPNGERCLCRSAEYPVQIDCESATSEPPIPPQRDCRNMEEPPTDGCGFCECTDWSGKWEWRCFYPTCQEPPCADAVSDKCCPYCPNGPNCEVDGVIIPVLESRKMANGSVCHCGAAGGRGKNAVVFKCEDPGCRVDGVIIPFGNEQKTPHGDICFCDDTVYPAVLRCHPQTTPYDSTTTEETTTLQPGCAHLPRPYDDPCNECECAESLGVWQWQCRPLLCMMPYCANSFRPPGECCYQCPKDSGCLEDGVTIPSGEMHELANGKVCYCDNSVSPPQSYCFTPPTPAGCDEQSRPIDVCGSCECSNYSGKWEWQCYHPTCPEPNCADAVYGKCCPYCPNGPNCQVDGVIIPLGEMRETPNGQQCYCVESSTGRYQAVEPKCGLITTTPEPGCFVDGMMIPYGDVHEMPNGEICYCDNSVYPAQARCHPASTLPPTPSGCRIEDKPTDNCAYCECSPWSGEWQCMYSTCMPPQCADARTLPGQCCPICPNGPNCMKDGIIIPYGETRELASGEVCYCDKTTTWYGRERVDVRCEFRTTTPAGCQNQPKPYDNPCSHCECVEWTGEWQCYWATCEMPPCVDAYAPPGQCCPICPNGPNCAVDGGVIIAYGDVHEMANGDICYCSDSMVVCEPPPTTTPEMTTVRGCDPQKRPPENPCTFCECGTQGDWVCMSTTCAVPQCADSVTMQGECCPTCPNGPNCQAQGIIIPLNGASSLPGGVECQCSQIDSWAPPVAVCRTVTTTTTTTTPKSTTLKPTTPKPTTPKPTTLKPTTPKPTILKPTTPKPTTPKPTTPKPTTPKPTTPKPTTPKPTTPKPTTPKPTTPKPTTPKPTTPKPTTPKPTTPKPTTPKP